MAKKSIKHKVVPVPQSLDEAAKFLAQIGKEQRTTDMVQSSFNTKVEKLKAKVITDAKSHQEKIFQLVEGLFAYAEVHRDELTDDGKRKTVGVPTGIFGWRMTPPAISLRDVKSILVRLKALGLNRFIRTKLLKEVNKEAMLKEIDVAKTVKGVSISQREEFIVKPAELEVEIATQVDKLKRAVS